MPNPSQNRQQTQGHKQPAKPASKLSMQRLPSPYNFVPLNEQVYRPNWGFQVSQDLPFEKGLSGILEYTLEAQTPILVAGEKSPQDNMARFHQMGNRHSIPGATIRGMLRAIIETITWGKMANLDDLRPSLRDITGMKVAQAYMSVLPNVAAGILRQKDGKLYLHTCEYAKLPHSLIEKTIQWDSNGNNWIFPAGPRESSVAEKYKTFQNKVSRKIGGQSWDRLRFDFKTESSANKKIGMITRLGEGPQTGILMLTAQISDRRRKDGKASDFIFFGESRDSVELPREDWSAFLSAHDDTTNISRPWPNHWSEHFKKERWLPVFYIKKNNQHYRLGLARMPRLAADRSTHECIDALASGSHRQAPGHRLTSDRRRAYDFAELLFGTLGETQDFSLRGRVSCEGAVLQGQPHFATEIAVILSTPKPSFFPAYIQQQSDARGHLAKGNYQTWLKSNGQDPQLRGRKRYPVRPETNTRLPQHLADKDSIQTRLAPLEKGSRFRGRIVFHNLKQVELGALLWALIWGGDTSLLHSIGMGKPYGFGAAHATLDYAQSMLENNAHPGDTQTLTPEQTKVYMESFSTHMNQYLSKIVTNQSASSWEESEPIRQLRAMADPKNANSWGSDLRYPDLNNKEFQNAKKAGLVLAPYIPTRDNR